MNGQRGVLQWFASKIHLSVIGLEQDILHVGGKLPVLEVQLVAGSLRNEIDQRLAD